MILLWWYFGLQLDDGLNTLPATCQTDSLSQERWAEAQIMQSECLHSCIW